MSTPSGTNSLSLFAAEAQAPSLTEEGVCDQIYQHDIDGVPALADGHADIDHLPTAPPADQSPLRTGGIRFTPYRGLVLWCDFQGYRPGEIGDKVRPAIVVSRWELNQQTVCVVPVTQAASWATPLDVCLPADRYPFFTPGVDQWVMVSRITHVGHARLDRMRINGKWHAPSIAPSDLTRILAAVASIFALPEASEQARSHQPFAASSSHPLSVAYFSEQLLQDLIDSDPPESGPATSVTDISKK